MAKSIFVAAIAAACVVGSVWMSGGARPTRAAGDCWSVDPSLDPEEVSFYLLLNQYRADNGLAPLGISTNLTRAAAWYAEDMAEHNYFGHVDRSGASPEGRANACGYPYGTGENAAAGTVMDTGREAFEAWKNSPEHNENMLYGAYAQVGIGRYYVAGSKYGWYWVTDFGVASDGTDGSDLRIAESGVKSAGLRRGQWNEAVVLPGGVRVRDLQGYTAWDPLANGWWQQWGPNDYVPGGTRIGLLPIGMSMDKGRNPR